MVKEFDLPKTFNTLSLDNTVIDVPIDYNFLFGKPWSYLSYNKIHSEIQKQKDEELKEVEKIFRERIKAHQEQFNKAKK
ncbi:hypothetical protein HYO65_gp059 [Tenacibaculum phage PTm1]|uniref:Uncharacterized protein n=2 Tax=Shirahamavirus PTm1 TaxID=2846435 RepID=A0A5S9HXG9_9CAUD|nr:hypothetical protein HYO65_gp059 [Tenacibaculum phage PTm1]BBI90451.1 hypothetical protein [Tenacibaculum phage PTm1]BBI90759.1 hypothetical protein [Tenacibaculum phage PTm5]